MTYVRLLKNNVSSLSIKVRYDLTLLDLLLDFVEQNSVFILDCAQLMSRLFLPKMCMFRLHAQNKKFLDRRIFVKNTICSTSKVDT